MGAKFFYRNIDLVYFVNNKLINNNLITQKDRMLLSFSGGQDSICFVFILNQLYSQLEFDITFFWCHHLWQTDSFYLMQQITKLSFLLQFNSCFPIPLNYISSELLARKWRMECSYRVSLFYNYSKICLAHTFNDKVENIFLNFIRGTGLIGLAPLRWTQFISKSNITNDIHILEEEKYFSCKNSREYAKHNYLNSSCFTPCKSSICLPHDPEGFILVGGMGYTNRRFITPTKMNPNPPHVRSLRGYGSLPHTPYPFGVRASLKVNGSTASDMCILQDNFDKLKNLTKQVIKKFIQRDSQLLQIENLDSSTKMNPYPRGKGYAKLRFAYASEPSVRRKPPLKCNFSGDIYILEEELRRNSLPLPHANRRFARGIGCGVVLTSCVNDCYIVRPLLSISRIQLNKICYFWKLPIYPDKSNQKVKFFRNRVRGQLLPTIKLFFNLNIENIFLQLAKIIETEDYCLTQIVNEFTKNTDVYHSKLNIYSKKNNYHANSF